MNIDKDTYEELGLEGQLSEFSKKRRRKYGKVYYLDIFKKESIFLSICIMFLEYMQMGMDLYS